MTFNIGAITSTIIIPTYQLYIIIYYITWNKFMLIVYKNYFKEIH